MLLERLLEKRASVSIIDPRDPVLAQWFGLLSNTAAGVSITPDQAKRVTAVYTCVRIIAESIASLPLNIYRRLPRGGKEVAFDHPMYGLLHDAPNSQQTSYEWREMMAGHVALRGNGYSEIIPGQSKAIAELRPLHPDRVRLFERADGSIVYEYRMKQGGTRLIMPDYMLHFRAFTDNTLAGEAVVEQNREAIGLAAAAEQFGATFFGNGTQVNGVLQYDKSLDDKAFNRLRDQWAERHQGSRNANKPAILEDGLKWQAIGIPPEQAQFLETRKFQISEIARMFRIPPHMLADLERATFSNIEEQSLAFVRDTLRPWLVRLEQRMNASLLSAKGRSAYLVEFEVAGISRGNMAARKDYYTSLFNLGAMNANEIRAHEGMNPIEGGDRYYVPLNMVATDEVDPDGGGDDDPDTDIDSLRSKLLDAQYPYLRQAVDRIVTAEVKALKRALEKEAGFDTAAAEFYRSFRPFIERHIRPVAGVIAGTDQALGRSSDSDAYTKAFADAYMQESLQELNAASHSQGALRSLLDRWEAERVSNVVLREVRMADPKQKVTT